MNWGSNYLLLVGMETFYRDLFPGDILTQNGYNENRPGNNPGNDVQTIAKEG